VRNSDQLRVGTVPSLTQCVPTIMIAGWSARGARRLHHECTTARKAGVTRIEREHFLLHAPFQWVAVPGDKPLEFEFQ